jgi:hypothetical protein
MTMKSGRNQVRVVTRKLEQSLHVDRAFPGEPKKGGEYSKARRKLSPGPRS